MEPFADLLARGAIVLFDGAMGTRLYQKGVFINRAFEELNLTRPGLVRDVHAEYVAAGAAVIETNTFAANRFRLSAHGLAEKTVEINAKGAEVARDATGGQAHVAGSIGPLGVRIEPFGPIARAEARAVFEEQARALADAGVDLFVVETFTHLPEIVEALHAVRAVSDLPVVAQVCVGKGGVTREGVAAADAAERLVAAGANAVGVNCSEALAALDALEEMRRAVGVPLSGQPNAGSPRTVAGRNMYLATPDYLVAWAKRALRVGARFLGGCCGTTPDHIRALRQITGEPVTDTPAEEVARPVHARSAAEPVATAAKSGLAGALAAGRFVTGVEMPLPTGWDTAGLVDAARRLAEAGVDFVSLPEGARVEARMPPIALAPALAAVEGLETVCSYSCRGRRLPRMQSDLLGAFATGARNLLCVTGEPLDPAADAPPDLDVDSIGMVNLVARLNHGEDRGGSPLGKPTAFHVGVRIDPTAFDREREIRRTFWKVDAGAEFAVTAPVFDPGALRALLDDWEGRRVPVLATIWPLRTAREAEFFEQEMAQVPVPADLVERMMEAECENRERDEGLAIARELAAAVRPMVHGLQVVAPDADPATALELLHTVPGQD